MEMSLPDHLPHPKHCFCHIPGKELQKWAFQRYKENISTVDLLASTDDPREKEIISAVALLDVDDATLLKMMGDVNLPEHHILHCREKVRVMIKTQLKVS